MQTVVLTRAELETYDPTGGKNGRWLCPIPGICSEHTDPRKHRSINVDENSLWKCHRCNNQGQLKDAWKPFERKTRQELATEHRERENAKAARALASHVRPVASEPVPVEKLRGVAARLGKLHRLQSPGGRAGLRYVQGRGFNTPDALALLDAADVRFSTTYGQREATDDKKAWKGTAAVVFPVRDRAGKLTAAQGRMVAPAEGMPKVLTFGDKKLGAFVTPGALESLEAGLPVGIAEAPFDALSLALCGLPALALCGCDSLPEWITRRAFNRRFLLAFDGDEAGEDAARKLTGELRGMGGLVSRLKPEGAKDWNEALQTTGPDALRALIAREAGGSIATGSKVETIPSPTDTELPLELLELGRSIDLEHEISAIVEVLDLALDLERFGDYAPVHISGGRIDSPAAWLRSAAGRIEQIARRVLAPSSGEDSSLQGLTSLEKTLAGEALKVREVIAQICTPVYRKERPAPC